MAKDFQVSLVTPEQMVFQGPATYVQLPAHDGQLGVAANRAPMLVKMGVGKLRIESAPGSESQDKVYVLDGGFAQMQDNKLSLISERAIDASELTGEQAHEALDRAEALPKTNSDEVARRDHDLAMARTMIAIAEGN